MTDALDPCAAPDFRHHVVAGHAGGFIDSKKAKWLLLSRGILRLPITEVKGSFPHCLLNRRGIDIQLFQESDRGVVSGRNEA